MAPDARRDRRPSGRLLTIAITLAIAGTGALALAAPAPAVTHAFKTTFAGSGTNALASPSYLAVDNSSGSSAHDVYVTDPANYRVEKFSPSGAFILMFGKEVNETKVLAAAPEAEQDICTAASLDTCKAGSPSSSAGGFQSPAFIAVDSSSGLSSGDVYVADPTREAVQKFDQSGSLIASWGENGALSGLSPLNGIAVDLSGNLFVLTGTFTDWYEPDGRHHSKFNTPFGSVPRGLVVDGEDNLYNINCCSEATKYTNTGEYRGRPQTHGEATSLAIAPSTNDLYVVQSSAYVNHFALNCGEACEPLETFGGGLLSGAQGMSIDGASETVYVADPGAGNVAVFEYIAPTVATGAPSGIGKTSATLNGHVDPAGHGEITECYFEYGEAPTYNLGVVPCSPALPYAGAINVTANVIGLQPKTQYQYRIAASNAIGGPSQGSKKTFVAAGSPSIDGFYSSDITPATAVLHARVNPDRNDTTVHFEFGTTTEYGESTPVFDIGSGEVDENVAFELTGLRADAIYHFRVVAENSDGTSVSADQSFGFYPPGCPNRTVRQRTGADHLPDCRAYELASAENSGDSVIFASLGPNTGRATSPSRLAYVGWGGLVPGAGEQVNTMGDLYAATRTETGWTSKYIGLPGNEAFLMGGPPWATDRLFGTIGAGQYEPDKWQIGVLADPSMTRIVDWNDGQYTQNNGQSNGDGPAPGSSNAPYVWDSTTGQLVDRWPTNVESVPNGDNFSGETVASADLSHFVFSSGVGEGPPPEYAVVGPAFAEGGLQGDIYDNNTETGTVAIISRAANGDQIPGLSPLKASETGSHILMTTGEGLCKAERQTAISCGPGELYMRVNDAALYELAPGHSVSYVGMAADGAKVYFTSPERLSAEDTDDSTDLYMWSEVSAKNAEPPLTLVSAGSEGPSGPGNSDSCSTAWTTGCGIVPIVFTDPVTGGYTTTNGGAGGNGTSDNYIASETGEIYFYSPERLVAGKGVAGNQNLYVYRNAHIQFVAALQSTHVCEDHQGESVCSAGPVARMQISPDGSHMAFITASKVTSYDNAGFSAMYSYAPATEQITCNSCAATGEPGTADVYGSQDGLFMADDGRTFFSTEEALVPQDTNESEDVYEYSGGRPQLITSGTAPGLHNSSLVVGHYARPGLAGVSADGTDVYFATFERLVGQDLNGQELKIYDARTNGGFPFADPPPSCVAADECHGPGSAPPAIPADGTAASLGGHGNLAQSKRNRSHRRKKRHRKHHPRPLHRGDAGVRHG